MKRVDRDAALFWDMLQACREITGFVADKDRGQFISDRMLCLAVERCLEILGEAAGHVSSPCQDKNPEIPWRRMTGMRNILAHDYAIVLRRAPCAAVTKPRLSAAPRDNRSAPRERNVLVFPGQPNKHPHIPANADRVAGLRPASSLA
jgi:uncharacterized protein with HEPN domain